MRFVEILRLAGTVVDDPIDAPRVCRDPDDDYLIVLARAAEASVLVSGDLDLTSLDTNDPPIVTPRRFLTTIRLGFPSSGETD